MFLVITPLFFWELGNRPPQSMPWSSAWDDRSVRDIIMESPILVAGNSMVGALPREFFLNAENPNTRVFNLESVLYNDTQGVTLRSVELLDKLGIANKTVILEVDSYQWSNSKFAFGDSTAWSSVLSEIQSDRYRTYRSHNPFKMWSFGELPRLNLSDLLKYRHTSIYSQSFKDNFLNTLYHVKWSLVVASVNLGIFEIQDVMRVIFPQMETSGDYYSYYPILRELIERGALNEERINRQLRPRLIKGLYPNYMPPPSQDINLASNFETLTKLTLSLQNRGNRVVLIRLPRDKEIVDYEDLHFPRIAQICQTWKTGCIDLSRFSVFLFDGAHPHAAYGVPKILEQIRIQAKLIKIVD